MIVGDGGRVALLKPDGTVTKKVERMGGADLVSVSWSGRYWLIVAKNGEAQRLRADTSAFKSKLTSGLDRATHAEFNQDEWIVVGSKGGTGAFAMFKEDGSTHQQVTTIGKVGGPLRAADWSGREWLTGGAGGFVARVDQSGSVIRMGQTAGVRNVLYGHAVYSIEYNGEFYLVGGGSGAIRKLQFDTLPVRPAEAVNGFETVHSIEWAAARGYPGGPCVSDNFCFDGTCIGGVSKDGFCCESDCEGPCQSCLGDVTGKSDGTCAPVPAGDEPPQRKKDNGQDCVQGPKSECKFTGTCDGNGSCAYYGTDVQCQPEVCENGVQKSAAFCNGSGDCVRNSTTECDPYAVCESDAPTCANSCSGGDDCVEGFVCVEGACVDPSEQMNPDAGMDAGGGDTGDGDGEGCATAAPGTPIPLAWFLLVPAVVLLHRRSTLRR